ncbi:hypothetical protein [uncultured Streptomyces sp.]|uniref:hypothetical protein n=1 Tax=uncultured Streptomyces sp. TaxID=174707 RepID=UPI00262FEDE8|nr:hypothetical protein [uncultured Streptomyces sp.]
MQRTRITVTALLGTAVAALSGCVSVTPGPANVPVPRPAATAAGEMDPQVLEEPGRESLGALPDPTPSASSAPPETRPLPGTTRPARDRPADPPAPPRRPRPAPPAPPLPRVLRPAVPVDVCALGRGVGRWPAGSPQARICESVYG